MLRPARLLYVIILPIVTFIGQKIVQDFSVAGIQVIFAAMTSKLDLFVSYT